MKIKTRTGLAQTDTKRRISRGAMIAALLGTLVMPPTAAQAAPCHSAGAAQLSKGDVSIEVRRLQTNLMVAALSCRARAEYNDFITSHRSSLQKHGKAIRAEFRRRYGRDGSRQLNRFVTRLANEASARSNADRDAFCADASAMFEQAKSRGMSVNRMVRAPSTGTQVASAGCDATTAAGFQSVSGKAKSQEQ